MSITDQIEGIISRRNQERVEVVVQKIKFFEELQKTLNEYCDKRGQIMQDLDNQSGKWYDLFYQYPQVKEAIQSASPTEAMQCVKVCKSQLDSLQKRFERGTINISVIGRAGQGKSRLLQTISRVDDSIIPAAKGGDCTGTKSVICNDEGETKAIVRFYAENELLETVQKYLDEFDGSYHVSCISEIKSIPVNEIDLKGSNRLESYLKKLRKYVEHYDEYVKYLGTEKTVGKDEIRNYVAQRLQDGTPVYQYLAVKEVEIHTPFAFSDAGKIMLVDTIGLGDTSIGLHDKMLDTLANDSDAAILLRRPDVERDDIREEDNTLYDEINEAMKGRDLSLWLFYVLNTYGDNKLTSDTLKRSLESKRDQNALQVAFIKQIDCANETMVQNELLVPLLDSLSKHLDDVDEGLLASVNKDAEKACDAVIGIIRHLSQATSNIITRSANFSKLFFKLFKELKLSTALNKLNQQYIVRNKRDEDLFDSVKGVLRKMSEFLPTEEDIVKELEGGDKESHFDTVFNRECDNLRTKIRDEFDDVCREKIIELQEGIKEKVIDVLKKDGLFEILPLKQQSYNNNVEWLSAFVSEYLEEYPILKNAFNNIVSYSLHIEGLLQFKVHCALDVFEECVQEESPDGKRPPIGDVTDLSISDKASVIRQTLTGFCDRFATSLNDSITELLIIPNNSFNALIRRLRDTIAYGEEGGDVLKSFYLEKASLIWKDEFSKIVEQNELVSQYKEFASCLEKYNKKESYCFTKK